MIEILKAKFKRQLSSVIYTSFYKLYLFVICTLLFRNYWLMIDECCWNRTN